MSVARAVAIALAVLLLAPAATSADEIPHDVVVTITDNGFAPGSVVIPLGGSVTWSNKGTNVHTATSLGGAPQAFNTGGFSGNQTANIAFTAPGLYGYTSATDCLNGNNMPGFVCGTYSVTVVAPGAAVPTIPAAPEVPPTPQITPVPTAFPTVSVNVGDGGISPSVVAVLVGGTVTWTNQGTEVHTVTSQSGPIAFDSGGLAPGQSSIITFPLAGTYTYTSASDCLLGAGNGPGFTCGPYTVVVQAPR